MLSEACQIAEDNPEILALAKILSDGKKHKAAELALKVGSSERKVRHYLRFMRAEMQLPIESSNTGFLARK